MPDDLIRPAAAPTEPTVARTYATLAGDLASISVFDAVQVLENAKLTGELVLKRIQKRVVCFLMRDELSMPNRLEKRVKQVFVVLLK